MQCEVGRSCIQSCKLCMRAVFRLEVSRGRVLGDGKVGPQTLRFEGSAGIPLANEQSIG
jgi:hypothetical protein